MKFDAVFTSLEAARCGCKVGANRKVELEI